MEITSGTRTSATPHHSVKALVVVSCNEYDHQSRSSVAIVTGGDAIHVSRGPWSAHRGDVVTIITHVHCMDTLLKSLEVASHNDARFYMVAIQEGDGEGLLEAWSNGSGQVYGVGVDCDHELPSSLWLCRDEARAIAGTTRLAEALANMAAALSLGLGVSTLVHAGGA
jgi:hypothetical protein